VLLSLLTLGQPYWDVPPAFGRAGLMRPDHVAERNATERVVITAEDGVAIHGRFVRAGDGRRGVVLFSMCSRDAIDGWTPVVDRLAAAGISSLAVTSPTPRPVRSASGGHAHNTRASDADVIVGDLAGRLAPGAVVAVGGGSCGVHLALLAATRHAPTVRAALVLSGPYDDALRARLAQLPALAVFSGASRSEGPAIGWAEALRASSSHPHSRVLIREGTAHGTDMFAADPVLAADVTAWIDSRLR